MRKVDFIFFAIVFCITLMGLMLCAWPAEQQFDYEITANGETWVVSRIHWNFGGFSFEHNGNRVIIVGDAKVLRRTK